MLLSEKHKKQFACFYLVCFLLSFAWNIYYGLTFSATDPVFFLNRPDITRNLLMLTGIQHLLLRHRGMLIFFDLLYIALPVLMVWLIATERKGSRIIALCTAFFNIIYNIYFSSMSFVSIEVFVPWMLVPLIFYARTTKGFYYNLHSIRVIFILIFFSSAVWKIVAGGIFNPYQMSAVLLLQHATLLSNGGGPSGLIYFFVNHHWLSYSIYFLAFAAEFIFIIGMCTKKFDRYFIWILAAFIFADYFVMFINYFSWAVFAGCFYFSRYSLPDDNVQISKINKA